MTLSKKEIEMFKQLKKSDLGKTLRDYIEKLEAEVCDVRNWSDKDTPESARQAAGVLRQIRTHLKNKVESKESQPNEYI